MKNIMAAGSIVLIFVIALHTASMQKKSSDSAEKYPLQHGSRSSRTHSSEISHSVSAQDSFSEPGVASQRASVLRKIKYMFE